MSHGKGRGGSVHARGAPQYNHTVQLTGGFSSLFFFFFVGVFGFGGIVYFGRLIGLVCSAASTAQVFLELANK